MGKCSVYEAARCDDIRSRGTSRARPKWLIVDYSSLPRGQVGRGTGVTSSRVIRRAGQGRGATAKFAAEAIAAGERVVLARCRRRQASCYSFVERIARKAAGLVPGLPCCWRLGVLLAVLSRGVGRSVELVPVEFKW